MVSLLAAGKAAWDGAAVHNHSFAPGAFGHCTTFDWKIHRADSCRIMLHCPFAIIVIIGGGGGVIIISYCNRSAIL